MMRRFGGAFNYEDYIDRGYNTNDAPDAIQNWNAKAGDDVIVAFFNGEGREGVILGGLTHAARSISLDPTLGPQYQSEFNGINTNINADGEWTLIFKGQPTNLSALDAIPRDQLPTPTYDTTVGSSFMKFDKTGSWTISDNATSDPQSIFIDKPNGVVTTTAGQVSLVMNKGAQSVILTCKDLTINSSNSITENTATYKLTATTSATIDSPKIAFGTSNIELLDQLSQLITALGNLIPISPVGPCTELSTISTWPAVKAIQDKINQIKGTIS